MPTSPQHRAKAENNEFFATDVGEPFWDWAVTGLFYSALHYVEAYLASLHPPFHPPTHQIRDSLIHREPRLRPIYVDYRELQDESRDARYDPAQAYTQNDVVRLVARLQRIKQTIIPYLPN